MTSCTQKRIEYLHIFHSTKSAITTIKLNYNIPFSILSGKTCVWKSVEVFPRGSLVADWDIVCKVVVDIEVNCNVVNKGFVFSTESSGSENLK